MSIPVRLESNTLTPLPSYRIRFVPNNSAGREDIAADIALRHPNFSKKDILTILNAEDEVIALRLLNGEQVTKEGCCTWYPSFTGKLANPDDPMPPLDKCLRVNVRVSAPFLDNIRKNAHIQRLPMTEKLPVITSTEDPVLGLKDVLRADGMLRLTGSNLFVDREKSSCNCLLEGTNNGSAVQTRLGTVSKTEIILMPDVPSQTQPWHNEYRLSVTTQYTENGTLRTGIYKRMLRTMLGVRIGDNPGILSRSGTVPLVTVSGGMLAAEGARLRIQALYNVQDGDLRFSLLDMKEGGKAGEEVRAAANGVYTLSGWPGCDVTSLEVTVADYAGLLAMVRNPYGGRLVDILDVSMGS
jgi:hypothetical protein